MLRINLLPSYVAQRRLSKRLISGFVMAGVILIAALLCYNSILVKDKNDITQKAEVAVQGKKVTDDRKTQAASITQQIKPIQDKVDFVNLVHTYNDAQWQMYYTLAKYTESNVIYSDAAYSGSTMTIKAYVPSIAEVGRYLQRIYQDPQFTNVTVDHVPGYPDGYVNHYYVGKTLVSVGTPPSGGGQSTGGNGAGGYPGGGGGGYPGGGGPTVAGGQSTTVGGFGQPVTPIGVLIQRQLNPLASARQQTEFQQQVVSSVRVKRAIQGFAITVTAILKNPPVPPVVPGGGGGAGAAGGGAAGGGAPSGGYPGGGYPGGVRTASNGG